MNPPPPPEEGQVLTGPQFSEPMRVVTVAGNGLGGWKLGLVGTRTQLFRQVTLDGMQLSELSATDSAFRYDGDGDLLRLGLDAHALGIAWEFDPYFGLSVSRVDPLPHQLEAVYDHLLKPARVRFLLADDAGAGKTIMSGLLLRELQLRGLAERILIVAPSNLTFQWQRELREKFDQSFVVLKGAELRAQYGVNQWMERDRIITSLDLAKRDEILPGLKQARWDLVIVDEAHRMSARDESHKSLRYKLGELLRNTSDHLLLLTATPHKGDPENFSLFLQLLDRDAYANVTSIRHALHQGRAPFYLRRTKEAMVHFPQRDANGEWTVRPIFTRRIPSTAGFSIQGAEHELYREVTEFVKRQSRLAAERDDPRGRAMGFLMALYQRRLASSTRALFRSLGNRADRLEQALARAHDLASAAPPDLPSIDDLEELDEMEEQERERVLELIEAISLTDNADAIREEIAELRALALRAEAVERQGGEAKLTRLERLLRRDGFFDRPDQRLVLFTEFKDTLDYLVEKLRAWGFRVATIHGGMKPGGRDEPGTRLHAEQQFREGAVQVLAATEAAGEGINLQVCNVLFNYDIPWNPNRLEQRMGRIHRYGQQKDCLIFNFVATNTVEGHVLERLLEKLKEIRNALDDDAVFNVVGQVLPASRMERLMRDYYAGRLGQEDLEERILRPMEESRFRDICRNALEGLASKRLNLEMLVERRARARERRVVPETIARFLREAAPRTGLDLRFLRGVKLRHAFEPGRTPAGLRRYQRDEDWRLADLATRYPRCTTDRDTAQSHNLEWVTPGHPLFEAVRRHTRDEAADSLRAGATFHSLDHAEPARIDFYRAQIVDGMPAVVQDKLLAVELRADGESPVRREPGVLGNLTPAPPPEEFPSMTFEPAPEGWLHEQVLGPLLEETRTERVAEVERVADYVQRSLTELLNQADDEIGRAALEVEAGRRGAEGRLKRAELRHDELSARRARRLEELKRQRSLTLQGVERITSVLVLPHPERGAADVRRHRPDPATEMTAMRVVMEHEEGEGRRVEDVSAKNLGYDVTSLDPNSGDLRLIEVKGLAARSGTILLTPNERRVAEDRPDCYWLYVVTDCATNPVLRDPVPNPAQEPWVEVRKVQHYYLDVEKLSAASDGRTDR